MADSWNWAGSKWWKFDFHAHTPASDDYGKGPNQSTLKEISPKEWLQNFMIAGIDCVAITDHNSGDWIDKLKHANDELKRERPSEYKEIYLFPGVEISVNGGIHLLAIFSENTTTSDIDGLIGEIRYQGEKGRCDAVTLTTATEIIKTIESRNGIAIPAHVDQVKGLFTEFQGTTLGQVLDCDSLHTNEIVNKNFQYPQLYIERKLNWSSVIGSDSHHPDNSPSNSTDKYPGSHFTWVKMSKPTIEGLKLALLDGNSLSIKRFDEFSNNPNEFEHLIIEEVVIKKAKYIGRVEGQEFRCKLNPWLNTIVGGRGTGKSTILEFIRICLDRKGEVPSALESDNKKYSEISSNRDSEGLLTKDTEIELLIQKDKTRYKIIWKSELQSSQIFEEKSPANWELVDGVIKQRFPVQIFSQKQIYELSKDTTALLKKIDNANIGYRQWDEERKQLVSNYLAVNAQIREKLNFLENESSIRGELDDISHQLRVFEERGYSDILTKFSIAQRDEDLLEFWKSKWIDSSERLSTICKELTPSDIDNTIFERSPDFKVVHSEIIKNFSQIQTKIKSIVKELNSAVQISVQKIEESSLSQRINEDKLHYQNLKQNLESQGKFILDEYNHLLKRKHDLVQALEQINQHRCEVSELNTAKERCFGQLIAKREEIQRKRSKFLGELLSGNQLIEIKIIPFGDTIVKIESEFRKLVEKEDGRFEKDISRLLKKIEEDPISGLTLLKETLREARNHNYSNIDDSRFGEHIERLDPEKIDRIMCYFPEDSLDVKYYDQKKGGLISISQGSPGQRNAALLAFLLIYGNEPLILDQPEDDLDNQLIYDSIVAQLREIKIKRQIIIVTHNANVVVNGDSENVIPLSVSSSAQTVISGNGSLQEPDVRTKVCEILEGGKEAFESRYRRINVGE